MYKRIGVKTNIKKHDEKKQGTAGNVSSRNCRKKRKAKSKEMTNTAGKHKEIRQRHVAEQNKAILLQQKQRGNEKRQKRKIMEQAHKGWSTTNLYLANTREVGP